MLCSRRANRIKPMWNPLLKELTGYDFNDVRECFNSLYQYYETCFAKQKETFGQKKDSNTPNLVHLPPVKPEHAKSVTDPVGSSTTTRHGHSQSSTF